MPTHPNKEFTEARVRYLIQALLNKKEDLPLRVASMKILLQPAKFHSGPQTGTSKPLPIDNDWLALRPRSKQYREPSSTMIRRTLNSAVYACNSILWTGPRRLPM